MRPVLVLMFASSFGLSVVRPDPASATVAPAPQDPVAAVIYAFRDHEIVALSEGDHGNEQGHAVRMALVRDQRLQRIVDDIVVEFGSAEYQDVVDRFISGEDVRYDTLKQVWQNTTQATTVWDPPIYEDFFRAVRAVNAGTPGSHKLRVLLGTPAFIGTGSRHLRMSAPRFTGSATRISSPRHRR